MEKTPKTTQDDLIAIKIDRMFNSEKKLRAHIEQVFSRNADITCEGFWDTLSPIEVKAIVVGLHNVAFHIAKDYKKLEAFKAKP